MLPPPSGLQKSIVPPATNIQGFILSRQSFDRRGKGQVDLWLSTADGPIKLTFSNQLSVCFIHRDDLANCRQVLQAINIRYHSKDLTMHSFENEWVTALYFDSVKSFFVATDALEAAGVVLFEKDFRLHERLLVERFIYGSICFQGELKQKTGYFEVENPRIKSSDYQPNLKVISIDIECSTDYQLFSIGIYGHETASTDSPKGRVLMVAAADYNHDQSPTPETVPIDWVINEEALIHRFIAIIQQIDPDVIIGWNVINFDCKILFQRSKALGIDLAIGRDKSSMHWRQSRMDSNLSFVSLAGRAVVDGIDALKNETYSFQSFSLDFVANELLGRGKLVENVHDRLEEIMHNFQYDKQKLAAYNLEDCVLVWDIFQKTQVLDFLIFRSKLTGLPLEKVGGSVASFTNLYLPKLHRAGYVAPNLPADGGLASPGGYVMDSTPGLYKHVLVLDYKSLYPSIIRTFKIDPMGLIEGLKNTEHSIEGFKEAWFDREKHFLPDIITTLWRQREQAKQNKDKPRSQAIKIIMNSFYGVLGSGGCRFYDTRLASSITMRGHQIMLQTKAWIEAAGYQVIYGDTDSTFVWLNGDFSHTEAQKIGADLADSVNQKWQQKLKNDFDIASHLEMEFENHYYQFLMPTIRGTEKGSKKRYAGLIRTGQSSDEDQWVFKGLESVRTDWTELAKLFQVELYRLVFNESEVSNYIQTIINQTKAGQHDARLVYRKRLRQPLAAYVKNIPPHVKAARIADANNQRLGRRLQYQNKGWISYVMTYSGAEPLDYQTSPLDYQHYIDKQLQPIADAILPFIGMSFERILNTQMDLF
jgi:DNA polymerase II